MHYMLVTSITLPLQAASNGRNYMHYMAHYMLSKMLMTHRRLGRTSGGAGRRAPGDCSQVETRMLVTSGHRRHVTRWPLMTSHEPGHATRPSAFRRDPEPRARLGPLIIPAPGNNPSRGITQVVRSTVASPSLPPVLLPVPAFFSPVSYVTR